MEYNSISGMNFIFLVQISDVVATGGGEVTNLVPATITCTFTGLLSQATVTWTEIEDDNTKYIVSQGTLNESNEQESTLTITKIELDTLTEATTYSCSITLGSGGSEKNFAIGKSVTVFDPGLILFIIISFEIQFTQKIIHQHLINKQIT